MRRLVCLGLLGLVASGAVASIASADAQLKLTPVGRVPFPERAFIVDLPRKMAARDLKPAVRENGLPVVGATLTPVGSSNLRLGTVLMIDTSKSMAGKPLASAIAAAQRFVSNGNPNVQVGLVTFNSTVAVEQAPTTDFSTLRAALNQARVVSYGTKIYDALDRSLAVLEDARVSAGSLVLLTDGADVGSQSKIASVIERAQRDHVRIFTVGLRSGAFNPRPLQRLASGTGATYNEAASVPSLGTIYTALGNRLATEYLLSYRSAARPGVAVGVSIELAGVGTVSALYKAPTAAGLDPYHRSLTTRFFLSPASLVLLSVAAALIVGWLLYSVANRPRRNIVDRVGAFIAMAAAPEEESFVALRPRDARRHAQTGKDRLLRRLEREFEIGEIEYSPSTFVLVTLFVTVLSVVVLAVITPPLALLGFLVPVAARTWVSRKVKAVRDAFADQLPETLQLLASALRSGHSLIGAMHVVVEQAPEPLKREFSQVLTDDQLGVPLEQSLRRIARRMKSRDMEQVGLLGELQRTVGGNSAEVLDTVVETVRERADVRRLAQTMTAQGRLARWILSVLPVVLAMLMLLLSPKLMKPMLTSTGGQFALVVAAMFVVAGSLWIKKIVEIEV